MRRTSTRPAVAVGLALALIVYVGCSSRSDKEPRVVTSPRPITEAPQVAGDGKKLFADWPNPAGALIFSGEQDGYLEPCGCSAGQHGGLGRRYDLIERLRAQGWPLALVDLGSLIANPAGARGGLVQTKVKFGVALRALSMMKYDGLALSAEDLKLSVDEVLGQFLNLGDKPAILCANVAPDEAFSAIIHPYIETAAGSVKVGVTSVLDPEAWKALNDPAKDALLPIKSPQEVLTGVLADLESKTDVQVLMVQGPIELARSLAETFPGFDVVVSTSKFPDAPDKPEMLNQGKTMLVLLGKKGKNVGVVGLFPGESEPMRYRRVTLDSKYKMAEPIRQLIDEEFPRELKDLRVVEDFVRRGNVKGAPGSEYVGAQSCKECHPNTFAKWASSKHAHAFESLISNPKRIREFDAECISCHTTGFEYNSGWASAEKTPQLKGNQCENCHGPASKHVVAPDDVDIRKSMALTAEFADSSRLCLQCHDEDNSPNFNFQVYYGKIIHKGLDTYADPKVHETSN